MIERSNSLPTLRCNILTDARFTPCAMGHVIKQWDTKKAKKFISETCSPAELHLHFREIRVAFIANISDSLAQLAKKWKKCKISASDISILAEEDMVKFGGLAAVKSELNCGDDSAVDSSNSASDVQDSDVM